MADYISKNKFKQQNTNEALYSDIIKSLKNSKDINLQGMDGFKYNPVNKKASYNMYIQNDTMKLLKYAADNSWWSNTKNFFSNLNPFKGSPDTESQYKIPGANDWVGKSLGMSGILGSGGGMLDAVRSHSERQAAVNRAKFRGAANYIGNILRNSNGAGRRLNQK